MMRITLDRPWLACDLPRPQRVLSWALNRPGFVTARRILWREVRNADLSPALDVDRWFAAELTARGDAEAVGLLTSRDVGTFREAAAEVEGIPVHAVVTAGLSNAESVGHRLPWHPAEFGTVNIALSIGAGLTHGAMIEALSIAVQARTTAVIAAGVELATGTATGTGTDCIALAADAGPLAHAGLHTPVGEAVGRAVRAATAAAVADWLDWREAKLAIRGPDAP